MPSQPIRNVAIIGVSGNVGKAFVEELSKTGKHTVTALTRMGQSPTVPAGVKVVGVDYTSEESLVSALRGQQFLVITLSVSAPPDTHSNIVKAAAKAGVPYIMPNVYGYDFRNEKMAAEDMYGAGSAAKCAEIEATGVSSYVGMACGFWYEWSLSLGEPWFGFDIKNKTVTFFDDGKTRISSSTWPQCGRALAQLLSLPETRDGGSGGAALSDWKNKPFKFDSFKVSQRDMLDSIHRIRGSTDADWTIKYEPSADRYKRGLAEMQSAQGDPAKGMAGFGHAMYGRCFFPNGDGNFGDDTANKALGLPTEDLDSRTKLALQMVDDGFWPF